MNKYNDTDKLLEREILMYCVVILSVVRMVFYYV